MGFRKRNHNLLFSCKSHSMAYSVWVSALWDAVMGDQTLVDVVAGIFTGVATALETVKKNLNAAWDGIKSAGEFIVDTVWDGILQTIVVSVRALSEAILAILPVFLPRATSVAPGAIKFGDTVFNLDISSNSGGLTITFGDYSISIPNILSLISPPETLSLTFDQMVGFINAVLYSIYSTFLVNSFVLILTNLFYVETVPSVQTRLVLAAMFIGLITFLTNLVTQQGILSDRQWKAYSYYMAIFHLFTFINLTDKIAWENAPTVIDGNYRMSITVLKSLKESILALKKESLISSVVFGAAYSQKSEGLSLDQFRDIDSIASFVVSVFGAIALEAVGVINGAILKMMLSWRMPNGMNMLSQRLEKLVYYLGYSVYSLIMAIYFAREVLR